LISFKLVRDFKMIGNTTITIHLQIFSKINYKNKWRREKHHIVVWHSERMDKLKGLFYVTTLGYIIFKN
jgi:hypothetical protein